MARRKTKSLCSLLPGKRKRGGPPNKRADPFENAVGTILALNMKGAYRESATQHTASTTSCRYQNNADKQEEGYSKEAEHAPTRPLMPSNELYYRYKENRIGLTLIAASNLSSCSATSAAVYVTGVANVEASV